jgi:hypothetical protein
MVPLFRSERRIGSHANWQVLLSRKLHRPVILALLSLIVIGCGQSASDADKDKDKKDADTPGVTLTADQVKSMGLATANARPAVWLNQVTGFGTVVPLDTIAQSDADFLTAQAAASQSQAAANRAKSLSTGEEAAVSREVVEAAQSKAAADAAGLALARRKTDSAFGIHAPWHNDAERASLMARLTSGRTVLVRVTFPLGALAGGVPAKLTIKRLGGDGGKSWNAATVWEAPADPNLPGRGFFALVDGSDLAQNEHVFASVPVGPAQSGFWVPASAVVMGDGATWVYLENGENHFLRTELGTGQPLDDGYFVAPGAGIAAGNKIVTKGAGLLQSRELNPSTGAAD